MLKITHREEDKATAITPDGKTGMYFHLSLENTSETDVARNCCVFLDSIYDEYKTINIKPELVEFKWKGLMMRKADVPPLRHRKFDLFHVFSEEKQLLLGINQFIMDWGGHIRNHSFSIYDRWIVNLLITSDNFPILRQSVSIDFMASPDKMIVCGEQR